MFSRDTVIINIAFIKNKYFTGFCKTPQEIIIYAIKDITIFIIYTHLRNIAINPLGIW